MYIFEVYSLIGLLLSPLTTWLYINLLKKDEDVTILKIVLMFIFACIPLFNIFVYMLLGGFENIFKFFNKVVIPKE